MESFFKPNNIEVYNSLKTYFDSAKEILLFSDTVLSELALEIKQSDIKDSNAFKRFLLLCFFKSTSHGMNIWLIASSGHHVEASIILKSVIELFINLKYITNQDPAEHIKLSEDLIHYFTLKEKSNLTTAIEIAQKYNDPILNDLNKRLNEINKKYPKGRISDYWPKQSVSQLAKKAGLLDYYKTVYNLYSGYSHLSSRALFSYHNPHLNNWGLYCSEKNIDAILITFYEIYFDIIKSVGTAFIGHPFKKETYFEEQLELMKQESLKEL